jgi:nucleoside-diphosphate-sugar epimerase
MKLMDTRKIKKMGWEEKVNLKDGIKKTIIEFNNKEK